MALWLSCASRAATRTAHEATCQKRKDTYLARMEKKGAHERRGDENKDNKPSVTCCSTAQRNWAGRNPSSFSSHAQTRSQLASLGRMTPDLLRRHTHKPSAWVKTNQQENNKRLYILLLSRKMPCWCTRKATRTTAQRKDGTMSERQMDVNTHECNTSPKELHGLIFKIGY